MTRPPRKRVVIADRHEATRVLLRALLGPEPYLEVVGEAADGEEAVELGLARGGEIVVLDVNMPRLDGFEAAERIRTARPQAQLILHTPGPEVVDPAHEGSRGIRVITKLDFRATIGRASRRAERRMPRRQKRRCSVWLSATGGFRSSLACERRSGGELKRGKVEK